MKIIVSQNKSKRTNSETFWGEKLERIEPITPGLLYFAILWPNQKFHYRCSENYVLRVSYHLSKLTSDSAYTFIQSIALIPDWLGGLRFRVRYIRNPVYPNTENCTKHILWAVSARDWNSRGPVCANSGIRRIDCRFIQVSGYSGTCLHTKKRCY